MEHSGEGHDEAGKRVAPGRDSGVEHLTAVANIGLVGVPLAYVTSRSVVITTIAVVLAAAAVLAYVKLRRR